MCNLWMSEAKKVKRLSQKQRKIKAISAVRYNNCRDMNSPDQTKEADNPILGTTGNNFHNITNAFLLCRGKTQTYDRLKRVWTHHFSIFLFKFGETDFFFFLNAVKYENKTEPRKVSLILNIMRKCAKIPSGRKEWLRFTLRVPLLGD